MKYNNEAHKQDSEKWLDSRETVAFPCRTYKAIIEVTVKHQTVIISAAGLKDLRWLSCTSYKNTKSC